MSKWTMAKEIVEQAVKQGFPKEKIALVTLFATLTVVTYCSGIGIHSTSILGVS